MTNSETCMREMRRIVELFSNSEDFDEQWILFKAFLNTLHSLSDNDKTAKNTFLNDKITNFSLVLRNILHHQPKKWHYGKYAVLPPKLTISMDETGLSKTVELPPLPLVILRNTLEDPEVITSLKKGPGAGANQIAVLAEFTASMKDYIQVSVLINHIYNVAENYCRESGKYHVHFDSPPTGHLLTHHSIRSLG
ncbi:MAG: hypothetical protein Q7T96_19405 [Methylobacter sp.]|nr:hypothetical protein [Methylobacter sp.]